MISLTSFTPELMALKVKKGLSDEFAIILANVVFPIPGGHQKISEGRIPCLIKLVKIPLSPTKCC